MRKPQWVDQVTDRLDDVELLQRFHGWATILWATAGLGLSYIWMNLVPWLVFMSLWANVVGHWSAWQACRAEKKSDE